MNAWAATDKGDRLSFATTWLFWSIFPPIFVSFSSNYSTSLIQTSLKICSPTNVFSEKFLRPFYTNIETHRLVIVFCLNEVTLLIVIGTVLGTDTHKIKTKKKIVDKFLTSVRAR